MAAGEVRIGIVGAGEIARTRHLPGFKKLDGVQVVAVCNRRRETAARIARDFDIPRIHAGWEDLVSDPEVDAVVVAAWPYLHCPLTLAALDAGKHVLTQARMAMNAREAQRMFDRARECPRQKTMIVPSPYGLVGDRYMKSLIAQGFLGELREIHVQGLSGQLADAAAPLGWRQMTRYSGFNMLTLGILYESVTRWVPPAARVLAALAKLVPRRFDPELNEDVRVGTPDSVQVLTTQADGSRGMFRISGVVWHQHAMDVTLFGSEGTLVYDFTRDEIRGARRGETELAPLPIPEELRGGWRVEEEFVAAVRGEGVIEHTTFADGVRYMQFTEAVARSARHQVPVALPLKEFSNPSL